MTVVLILEDEILEQEFLKSIVMEELQAEDTILTCESGIQAVKLARQYEPDIIIMDIMITEMDGLTATEEIRKFLPNACISILSACSDFNYAQKSISLDVFEYLLKPVKPREFKELFHRMLDRVAECQKYIEEDPIEDRITPKDCQQHFMQKAIKYIKDHFKEKLNLKDVASEVYMNPKYFSQVFKKEMGISFSEYVNTLKIQHACRLLETTDFPAYRISMECGFSDPSYFSRVFSNQMNMTPQTYRKYACDLKNNKN